MPAKITSPADLLEIVNGYRKSRIILTAHELDIFTILDKNSLSSLEIAENIGANPRATDRLMNALVAIGLLEKSNSLFSNTFFSSKFLVKTEPGFLGGLSHQVQLWKTWSTMTDAVRKGSSVTIKESFGERDNRWVKSFLAAMHSRSQQARDVAELLDLSQVKKMLDVGGGSGAFTFAFLRKNKNIESTIFDLPSVINVTQEYINIEGFSKSVHTQAGDYLINEFGGTYDLVLVSAVIHINSSEENQLLINKCAAVLNPGGQLVILDHIMSEDRTKPEIGAIFALNMLVGTEKGDTYTGSEISSWMVKAGLNNIQVKNTQQETYVMIGTK
jgi:ubiquinone/menaquinone biosynthesis C-methylase UbiE